MTPKQKAKKIYYKYDVLWIKGQIEESAIKKLSLIYIECESLSKKNILVRLQKDNYISESIYFGSLQEIEKEYEEVKQEIEKL